MAKLTVEQIEALLNCKHPKISDSLDFENDSYEELSCGGGYMQTCPDCGAKRYGCLPEEPKETVPLYEQIAWQTWSEPLPSLVAALSELRDRNKPCVWRFFPSTSTIPAYHAPQCGGEGWRDRTDHIKFCPNCQHPVKVEEEK